MRSCREALSRATSAYTASAALAVALIAAVLPARANAQAGVYLSTQYRAGQKVSLMVLPIAGSAGDSISTMIARDLDYSDRFTIVGSTGPVMSGGPVNYDLYASMAVSGLVQGTLLPSGYLRVQLHDVPTKKVVQTKDFPLPASVGDATWRFGVHNISDAVEEWIVGQPGIASTRIAFERGRRIWTVDSDGANLRPVTENGMSAQWTPNGRSLVYNVLDGSRNPLMMVDLATGAKRTLVSQPGTEHITPAIGPDGRTLAFARISEAGTDLYTMPFDGGTPRRITVGRGKASTQPSFSPDGQRLAFASDRSGHNEVYISDLDGTNVEQLTTGTFGDREQRGAPDWSPDGQKIAYESLNGGTYQIMILNVRDQSTRQVTSDGRNQDPAWAPDSRHVVVTSHRSGNRQLWVVDTETGRTRQLTRGPEARLAAWSPRLGATN